MTRPLASRFSRVLGCALLVAAGGCSSDGTLPVVDPNEGGDLGGGGMACLPVIVDPGQGVVEVAGPASQPLQLRAFRGADLASRADVTNVVSWTLSDAAMGRIDKGVFTPAWPLMCGGTVVVKAGSECPSDMSAATIVVRLRTPPIVDHSAPNNADMAFDGPVDNSDPLQLAYPLDDMVMPWNLPPPKIQWTAHFEHQLFRITIRGDFVETRIYVGQMACTPSGGGKSLCAYLPTSDAWRRIACSARNRAVTVDVDGVAGFGQPVTHSNTVHLRFSDEPLEAELTFFSADTATIKKVPFGSTTAVDLVKGGANTPYQCVGCHAVSSDGGKVAATFYGYSGIGGVFDGKDSTRFLSKPDVGNKRWNSATWSPDGGLLLTGWSGVLTLFEGNTIQKKRDLGLELTGGLALQPAWSPDGTRVAFVQMPPEGKLGMKPGGDIDACNAGSIAVMQVDNERFLPATVIVPSVANTEYHFYPTWSPDSRWLVFASARAADVQPPGACVSTYAQKAARLRMVEARVGATPVELEKATHMPLKNASLPRFAPGLFHDAQGGTYAFLSFDSRMPFGLFLSDDKLHLWMAAVQLDGAAAGDPSHAPFWLPYQSIGGNNFGAFWNRAK